MSRGSSRALTVFLAAWLLVAPLGAAAPTAYQIIEIAPGGEIKGAPGGKPSLPGGGGGNYRVPTGQGYVGEVEPNNTSGTATPLVGTNLVAQGNVFPNADVDWYSFTAAAGDRLYAAVMTSFSANASSDSQLRVFQSDGTTLIEFDDDDGVLGGLSSTIANATLASAGTYFLEVRHFSATNQLRPYELHLRLQSGAPTPETEPNDTPATANVLPANGWVSGARNPAAATEQDWFSFTAAAGDTVYLSLDLDPERDNVQWNGRLGIALFGDANNQILVVDDASTGSVANPLSEALYMTIKTAGTYFAFVDSAAAATGGPTATYTLSVSIHPAVDQGINCTTYTSTNVPQTIGPGAGLVSSTITVPGNPRIADLDVEIQLNHTLMADLDVHLRSPASNDNGLFTDIGAAATGGQTQMDVLFDDEAAIPPLFTIQRPLSSKPELAYRLSWFDGEDAGGTWTLDIRDDTTNASGGTLTAWSLRICEPPPPPTCAPGFAPITVFTTDFEAGDAGFTHSGAIDEWERGLPATVATAGGVAAFNSCNSGTNCWKTDLDNTYNAGVAAGSPQDLLSAPINLAGLSAPVVVRWAQRYQIENATFDRAFVDYQQVGGATPVRLWEWLDATMTDTVGNPAVTIGESAGWGQYERRADSLAGLNTELRFNLTADNTVQLGGWAVDDVSVTACRPLVSDVSVTKTNGVTNVNPGQPTTYTIVASNAGPDPASVTVADTFPAALTGCNWTCVGAGGGTCTAAGAGNINDIASLPSGGTATYSATCTVAANASGILSNTATVTATGDPNTGNNSATDQDTVNIISDLSITKTDGLTNAIPGQATTYTIVASNAGPSGNGNAYVEDNFPAAFTGATWTCVGAGGGTCTAGGAGNIADTVGLPAGGSVTYTVNGTISGVFTGTLTNTATVALNPPDPPVPPSAPLGFPQPTETDPNPANNTATDTTNVGSPATVSGTKEVSGDLEPGGAITYTVILTNSGSSAQLDNPGDEFTDVLPPELVLVSASATSGIASTAGNTVSWNGSIPAAGSVTITIDATIDPGASGVISNQGTINFDADGNGSNESTAVTDDPVPSGGTDPTVFEIIIGAPAIPTLSEWGLMLMALLLVVAGWIVTRRRRTA